LGNGFVWDDPIILDRQLPIFRSLRQILLPPRNIPQFAPDYYRPVVIASYLLDRWLGGGSPVPFHSTVVLAHVLATGAVYAFALALLRHGGTHWEKLGAGHAWAAAAAAALFAVNPAHTEAVAWMAGRGDVFATMFAMAAAWFYLSRPRPLVQGAGAFLSLLFALLSKEVAIAAVLLLPLLDALFAAGICRGRRLPWRAIAARSWPAVAALGIYWILRSAALGGAARGIPAVPSLGRLLGALAIYGERLVYPMHLNAYIDRLPSSAVSSGTAGSAAVLSLAWAVRSRLAGDFVSAGCLAWMGIGLAPSMAVIVEIPEVPVAERYLYFPSVGFCVLAGSWAARLGLRMGRRGRVCLAAAAVALLTGLAGITCARNRVWRSDTALWTDTAAKSPDSGMPLRSLAVARSKEGRVQEAVRLYREALGKRNDARGLITIYNNLGTIALNAGRLEEAEAYYGAALAVAPEPDCLFNLALVALGRARAVPEGDGARRAHAAAALELLRQAEDRSPWDPDIQAALGQALALVGREEEARDRFRRSLELGIRGVTRAQIEAFLRGKPPR